MSGLIGFSSLLYANVNVVVSIVPQETFVQKIGGEKVHVTTMVQPGSNPHSYEPKPSQMRQLSKADVYFPIGIEFEKAWLKKFAQHNKKMEFIDITKGVEYLEMQKHHHHHDTHHHEEKSHNKKYDPHIWTSPANVKILASNIYSALVKEDSDNKSYYKKNYESFLQEIEATDLKIKDIFKDLPKHSKFMVFHPSWGYFAKNYGLVQFPVEVEGKKPKPKTLTKIIKEAKKEKVRVIFAQKELSGDSARTIANELGIKVVKVSPLSKQWSANLINVAGEIAKQQ